MNLKPFSKLIAMSKEKLDEAMAPIRAQKVKTKAALESAKIDEELVSIEAEIQEICASKDLDFDALIRKIDRSAILERRKKQYADIVAQLFP